MSRFMQTFGLVVALALPSVLLGGEQAKRLRPLAEAELLKLVELQIEEQAIIARLERGWVEFKVDDDVLKRLKAAGASDDVLARLRAGEKPNADQQPPAEDPRKGTFMVWVTRFANRDCPLHSALRINGELVNTYSSNTQDAIGKYLKMGWNTFTLTTTAKEPADDSNQLAFSIGPTRRDPQSTKLVMEAVLWSFNNDTDWSFRDGKYVSRIGPDVKEVTLSFRLYFAGLQYENSKLQNGDYAVIGTQFSSRTPPVIGTVFVNGTPLNSFLGSRRQLVITPLLKKGKNEIKLVTGAVRNIIEGNEFSYQVGGPAEYSANEAKFMLKPVVDFKDMTGWVQEKKTGLWSNKGIKPDTAGFERLINFNLDEAPTGK